MALTDGDRAECKEIAREIIKEVIKEHILMCPHGRSYMKTIAFVIGMTVGSGIAGGGVALGIAKLLTGI